MGVSWVNVYVNGRALPQADIDAWELERAHAVAGFLESEFGLSLPANLFGEGADIATIRVALMQAKLALDPALVSSRMRLRLTVSGGLLWFLKILSFGFRRTAAIEIVGDGVSGSELAARIRELFLTNSATNRELALLGSPDHYLVEAREGNVQEIIEKSGGAPLQTRVFVFYGPGARDGASDAPATIEMSGIARLPGGADVGSIRHSYADESTGFRARIADQFPALLPKRMVRAQELHLACEFGIWYRALAGGTQAFDQGRST